VPIEVSKGRAGGTPDLEPRYDSGAGNSPFGGAGGSARRRSPGRPTADCRVSRTGPTTRTSPPLTS
jgi:hypothetical protein